MKNVQANTIHSGGSGRVGKGSRGVKLSHMESIQASPKGGSGGGVFLWELSYDSREWTPCAWEGAKLKGEAVL